MKLCINMLLERVDESPRPRVERLLRVSADGAAVALIPLCERALPRVCPREELQEQLEAGEWRVLQTDPFCDNGPLSGEISEQDQARRDRNYALIQTVIQLPDMEPFDDRRRGPVIDAICQGTGVSKKHFYKNLQRFWQGGQRPNALLPRYNRCGGKGRERSPSSTKRGRPRKSSSAGGAPAGINITQQHRRFFQLGMKAFYNTEHKRTFREVYQQTLERHFNEGYVSKDGLLVPKMPSADKVPTFEQFCYWAKRDGDSDQSVRMREGPRRYALKHRGLGGDASAAAIGPGSIYQIDSTIADVYLVSSIDRNRVIGRPVLFLLVDVFSRLIPGFAVVLESASYESAVLAIENAAEDKVSFCAGYGVTISEEEWPCSNLPEMLVADRGEMLGKKSNQLVDAFGLRIVNTPPYRADLKPFIERTFRTLNDKLIHSLPGAVPKPHERGERDYRLEAALTIEEFRKAVIYFILEHNRSLVGGYRPRDFLLTDAVEPRPIDLWKWGIKNRSGHLIKHDPQFLTLNLLPGDNAAVTERGIRFRGIYYTCERAVAEQWFAKARQNGRWAIPIAYDPRRTSAIYLRSAYARTAEPCHLMSDSLLFEKCSWEEVDDYFAGVKELKQKGHDKDLQNKADYNAEIGNIVKHANAATAAAGKAPSKAAKIRNIRSNRKIEREAERRASLGEKLAAPEISPSSFISKTGPLVHTRDDEGYVGVPQDFETLEQQQEELCKTQ